MHDRRKPSLPDIEKFERVIATQAEHEAVLWGGPNRDGLVPSVTRLADAVTSLANNVTTLTARISGEDGMASDVKELKRELAVLEQDFQKKHDENVRRQDRQRAWLIGFGTTFAPGLAWLIYRSIVIAMQGHV